MQSQEQNKPLIRTLRGVIPNHVIGVKNRAKTWDYGYNSEYDIVVISKDGTIGEIVEIDNLAIALPAVPDKKDIISRSSKKSEQYWEPHEIPKDLQQVDDIFHWMEMPKTFKQKWIDYIDREFDRRENGVWFMNNGVPTYVTGTNYMYLQWERIDVGLPDFREANRILFLFWEACVADHRSFGMDYVKIRRSGASFMGSGILVDYGSINKDSQLGILSKTGKDAKDMFIEKVVPMSRNLPFFFRPIQSGMDAPKNELAYKLPATRITRKSLGQKKEDLGVSGLNTIIDWKSTDNNSYDGKKLKRLVHDECYAPETKILMHDMTFRPIKDIQVGDRVMVDGGAIKTVVKRTEGETNRYKVSQPYGIDYVVTENHRLVLHDYNKGEVIMTPPEYINSSNYRKKHLTRVVSRGVDSDDVFDGIPPYLLGLWLGDGRSTSMTIMVNTNEEPEIYDYLLAMSEIFGVKHDTVERPGCIEFRFKGINGMLRDMGVYNNKHIPDGYMRSSIDTRLQLLAGIIDSDGHSNKKRNSIRIGMSRKELIEQIRFLALSCGLSCSSVRHRKTNYNTDSYLVSISGDLAIIPMLTAKKSFSDYTPKTRGRRNKVDVSFYDVGSYVGIQVDADDDDGRRLILEDFTVSMNSGKWLKPNNIKKNWRVTKTCLRIGRKIIGKCFMCSTVNPLAEGGQEFKDLYEDSDITKRSANGQTKSGLYSLFIPMEWNTEGFIDRYGHPVMHLDKGDSVMGVDGELIDQGAIDWWDNEVEALKSDPDGLNEFYRQFPRTIEHAFRDDSKNSMFSLTKLYEQIDYNSSQIKGRLIQQGKFQWADQNNRDKGVVFIPETRGRFFLSWIPPKHLQNNVIKKNGLYYPGNEALGAFGIDTYDISSTHGIGSNGAMSGLTKFHMDPDAPSNYFFLEYAARPRTAEMFFNDMIMAMHFYGMPALVENNKPRLLYAMKNSGYRAFSINRPDKPKNKLTYTERELGGIPNSSEAVKTTHAEGIEAYIDKYVGVDNTGEFREVGEMGAMYFNRTLNDWSKFDISDRTRFDLSISSGLAIMACQGKFVHQAKKTSKISVTFATYNNKGARSRIDK